MLNFLNIKKNIGKSKKVINISIGKNMQIVGYMAYIDGFALFGVFLRV